YLTIAPYGNRAHGIVRAARLYFDKPVEDLSWAQSAFLAGLPQMPGRMNPWDTDGYQRALKRSHRILRELHEKGMLDEEELAQALSADVGLVSKPHRTPEAMHAVLQLSADAAKSDSSNPIRVATIDLDAQEKVASILRGNLERLEALGAGNSAALVVDSATGDVVAYVGSSDFFSEEHHGAIDFVRTKRSPGSALKPFIYALAIEKGHYTAATELPDTPMDVQNDTGNAYLPENINHTFLGPMLLREALGNSRNIPALRVLSDIGVEQALRLFEQGGVKQIDWDPNRYGLGLAIGNLNVTLEELTTLYGALANDGELLPLRRFVDEPKAPTKRMFHRETAELIRHVLSDPLARRPSFPAGSALDFPYAVAVKTGTSQGYRDAWTVAFSDRLIVGVWVGNHDWRRMHSVGGANGAADAAHQIMDALMPDVRPWIPIADAFDPPEGAVAVDVCPISGRKAGPDCPSHKSEWFLPGTAPTESCPFHAQVRLDRRNGLRAGPQCAANDTVTRVMLDLPQEYTQWAKREHLDVAPTQESPYCPLTAASEEPKVAIREPKGPVRLLFDPDTPQAASTLRLSAEVTPTDEPIVWLVDGVPVATVNYPYEYRWSVTPGRHVITAAMVHRDARSRPVTVVVED
ncbi:MAG: penicillin-binding transpeptidase domain-containing protein, partial [Myxococcaceae bacterium]